VRNLKSARQIKTWETPCTSITCPTRQQRGVGSKSLASEAPHPHGDQAFHPREALSSPRHCTTDFITLLTLGFKEVPPTIQRCMWQTENSQRSQEILQTFQRKYLTDTMSRNEVQRPLDMLDHPLWKCKHLAQGRLGHSTESGSWASHLSGPLMHSVFSRVKGRPIWFTWWGQELLAGFGSDLICISYHSVFWTESSSLPQTFSWNV
jgi:hypothetical protein